MFKKLINNKVVANYFIYGVSFLVALIILVAMLQTTRVNGFFAMIENKTFDVRQNILVATGSKKPNKDIVIVAVDDASYEYVLEHYGEWPIPRDVYANLVHFLEKQQPKEVAFDLMFVKSLKSKHDADAALVKAMKDYDNVFTAMNFDNQSYDLRKPITLPNNLSVNVVNKSKKIDFTTDLIFSNCRGILPQILEGTDNVGLINVSRADDGILRKMPPFMVYQGKFYPHMALILGLDYLKKTENLELNDFYIDKNSDLIIGKRKIPIDADGGAIMNWYGPSRQTYTHVPMYKLIKAMEGDTSVENFDFKDKIVYFGTTAVSLYDTKSVPVDKLYPGVEVHATYLNNLLDNNFIKKIDNNINILISIVLALFVGFIVISTSSTIVALGTTILTTLGYVILTYYAMHFFNLWIAIVLPVLAITLIFISAFIIKYLIKSRDFEHQYMLATTDGLTELYNHRFFQDQMRMQIDNSKRYNNHFSLIIIDIDFFKKFNDTYGHQAGDAVLKQVAQTLKRNVRATDIVCRYGGEEMSIILSNTDKDEAFFTAQKICDAVAVKPYKLNAVDESHVTISLGVATYPQDGETPQALIEKADNGLYSAKENGRNRVGVLHK